MLQHAVQDAGPVEPGRDGEPAGDGGGLARLGEITGEVGVSIRGLAAFTGEGRGVVHLLLDDQAVARRREALERAGMGIADQREVLVVDIVIGPAPLAS